VNKVVKKPDDSTIQAIQKEAEKSIDMSSLFINKVQNEIKQFVE